MSAHEHDRWEQLAAGFALDALEPEERADFSAHLASCAQCQELVDEHRLVAAQLGSLAGDDVAPPPWRGIRAGGVGVPPPPGSATRGGVVGEPQRPAEAEVVVLRRRPRFATLAAAAAVVAIAGAAVATWQLTRDANGTQPLASVAACRHTTGCHVVALGTTDGGTPADLLVHDGRVAVVPTSMPAPPAGSVWALWQVPRSGAPQLLTEFETGRHTAPLQLGYDETASFAVSRERSGATPTAPSVVVATGNAG